MPPKTKHATVGLVCVVKNEAELLPRLAASVLPLVDSWTVIDTGSTDGSQALVRELFGDLPGTLHERDWVSFGHNKTEALEVARGTADWLLVLDADMTVVGNLDEPLPHADALMVSVRDSSDFVYRLPLLISGSRAWRYEGVTHEYLNGDDVAARPSLDTVTVTHHCDGRRRPDKLHSDLELLTGEMARNPADPRTVFYLAQTHRDLGNIQQAIVLYRLRAEMGGFDEEAFYARYQLGCLLAAHVSFDQGADALLKAWRQRPTRIEPLIAFANSARNVAGQAPIPDDVLFVHRDQYKEAL